MERRKRTSGPRQHHGTEQFKEFVLPYEAVRTTNDPDESVLSFFQSTYEAGADLGAWDRPALERNRKTTGGYAGIS